METLKSILKDLEDKKINKYQAYTLINILFDKSETSQIKSSGDFRDDDNRESQSDYFGK